MRSRPRLVGSKQVRATKLNNCFLCKHLSRQKELAEAEILRFRKTPEAIAPSLWLKAGFNPLYDDGVDIALPKLTIPHEAAPGDRTHTEFVALVDAHGGAVLATLRRLCGNAHEADDLFQETAVRVWGNFDKRPWLRSPRAWLITVAYRTFLDSRRRVRRESPELIPDVIDHRHESAEEMAQRKDMRSQIDRCLSELPLELQQVMALHYQGGLSIRQTAAAMGASIATTKNRLHAALAQLRGELR